MVLGRVEHTRQAGRQFMRSWPLLVHSRGQDEIGCLLVVPQNWVGVVLRAAPS